MASQVLVLEVEGSAASRHLQRSMSQRQTSSCRLSTKRYDHTVTRLRTWKARLRI